MVDFFSARLHSLAQLLEGLIMSDWIGVYSTTESIKAGLDLEMPYVNHIGDMHSF